MMNVLAKRMYFYIVSGILFVFSLISILAFDLNLGIDMTGGTQTEYTYSDSSIDQALVTETVQKTFENFEAGENIITSVDTYKVTGENIFIVETGFTNTLPDEELETIKISFRDGVTDALDEVGEISEGRYTNIGASFGDYIKQTAKITLLIAIVGITIYIAYAFSGAVSGISSFSFAFITIVTLFHDVFISSGLYILASHFLPEFKIDTFFITALLTILGYSINDTIVVFDRIRANLRQYGGNGKELDEIVTISIKEVITRSLYTSITLLVVLVSVLVAGPESIAGFTLAMIFGTLVGTFSSICIASPLLFEINKNKELKKYVKKEYNPEDKIVV